MKALVFLFFFQSLNVDKALRLPQEPKKTHWLLADETNPGEDHEEPSDEGSSEDEDDFKA